MYTFLQECINAFVLILGLAALALGVAILVRKRRFRKQAMETTGTIVSVEKASATGSWLPDSGFSGSGGYPMIRYTIHTGQQFTFRHHESLRCEPGDQLTLYYNPETPTEFVVKTRDKSYMPLLLILGGVAFLVVHFLKLLPI